MKETNGSVSQQKINKVRYFKILLKVSSQNKLYGQIGNLLIGQFETAQKIGSSLLMLSI